MKNLKVVENGMVKIYSYEKENIVDARELHNQLNVKSRFNDWVRNRIKKYNFSNGFDYFTYTKNLVSGGKQSEYYFTIDTAKEIAMVENNDKGREIRKYFIEVEKRYRNHVNTFSIPTTFSEALRLAADQQEQIEEMKPKVESFEHFIDGSNHQKMNEVAKSLGIGRNKLFEFLRNQKVLMKDNTPYQRFINEDYFVVKEKSIVRDEKTFNVTQTYVTSKGVNYISKLLKKQNLMLIE